MSTKRQLAAIVFTDIKGYTSLMQKDEQSSIALRNKHREIFETVTEKHNGKIVQYFGDGTLSIFTSSVEAVHSCIQMQLAFIAANIPVRIGIHVGDIVQTDNDIIGDAVNVASRIESGAVAGSILVSDKIHDQIRSHPDIQATFLDAFEFKNVSDTIPLFAISNEGLTVPTPIEIKKNLKGPVDAPKKKSGFKKGVAVLIIILGLLMLGKYLGLYEFKSASTDKSIAVLPFDNLSTDSDAEIFRDGVTEDILTQLSKIKDLHVISRTSVMQYKGTTKTIPEIAKELGVSYILEGSIQKYGEKVRITAQLIDAKNDEHVWADNYDRTLTDIFEIQSDVSNEIARSMQLNLSVDEQQRLADIPTKSIEAYQLFIRGRQEADKRNKESLEKSIEMYEKALSIDPDYAEVYAEIANSTFLQTYYANADPTVATQKANRYLAKAEALNDRISRIYTVKGLLYNHTQQFDKAREAFEKAIELSPNDITARHQYATFFYYTGDYAKQLEQTKIAYRLDPLSFATASSYFSALTYTKRFDEAEKLIGKIRKSHPEVNDFLINRLLMRLYLAKPDYKKVLQPLRELAEEDKAYNRFLGYTYGKLGDTINAYSIIDSIKAQKKYRMQNHRIAVVFAGLQENDSVFHYLDTAQNKSKLFHKKTIAYFDYLKGEPRYQELLKAHGIE